MRDVEVGIEVGILTWAILREVTMLMDPLGSRGCRALNILFWSEVSVT